ncbi:MAG TPA: vitamin K epoxide reductase family protein [Candidatus Paceibacterota bacterium]|nr:vitamin K epoxide reductase family protein [Candidatus Paceibacterota bacterium]HMP18964.1 vitamin K epoxide reductase family protein [Candidatus Paceibacterota bacterium]HMP85477.1 vitamin K epoxide reductase family protein [Candidatus Paceibacterota bacterium]
MIFFISNSILAILGIFVSYKILLKKNDRKSKVCSNIFNCQDVLDSKFAKLFYLDIEKIGLLYYSILLVGYLWLIFFGLSTGIIIYMVTLVASVIGLCFSIYLILVQGLYLKNWCKLCVSSAIISIIIFIISTLSFIPNTSEISLLLYSSIKTLSIIQLIAISIGTSSATVSALLTIIFLKDFKIDSKEEKKLFVLDQIIWASILTLIIVNLGLYIANPQNYANSNLIISQLGILSILLLNNTILSLYVSPKLIGTRIDFKSIHVFSVFWLRQLALALGVISIVSWYSILITNFFIKNQIYDFAEILAYYISISLIAVILTQIAIIVVDQTKISRDNVYKFK